MALTRRTFLQTSLAASVVSSLNVNASQERTPLAERLSQIYNSPVLNREFGQQPVIIESMDLLRVDGEFLVRVRSRDGAEGHVQRSGNAVGGELVGQVRTLHVRMRVDESRQQDRTRSVDDMGITGRGVGADGGTVDDDGARLAQINSVEDADIRDRSAGRLRIGHGQDSL